MVYPHPFLLKIIRSYFILESQLGLQTFSYLSTLRCTAFSCVLYVIGASDALPKFLPFPVYSRASSMSFPNFLKLSLYIVYTKLEGSRNALHSFLTFMTSLRFPCLVSPSLCPSLAGQLLILPPTLSAGEAGCDG